MRHGFVNLPVKHRPCKKDGLELSNYYENFKAAVNENAKRTSDLLPESSSFSCEAIESDVREFFAKTCPKEKSLVAHIEKFCKRIHQDEKCSEFFENHLPNALSEFLIFNELYEGTWTSDGGTLTTANDQLFKLMIESLDNISMGKDEIFDSNMFDALETALGECFPEKKGTRAFEKLLEQSNNYLNKLYDHYITKSEEYETSETEEDESDYMHDLEILGDLP